MTKAQTFQKQIYILVVGCTGVGKSSLICEFLKTNRYEKFEDPYINNPFFKDYYSINDNKSFQSQMFFFKEFFKIHNKINHLKKPIIQERSIFESVEIFCKLLYKSKKIDANELHLFQDFLRVVLVQFRKPDVVIYLNSTVPVIHQRIRDRGRNFEKTIDLAFIQTQKELYEIWVKKFCEKYGINLFTIDNSYLSIESTTKKVEEYLINI